MRSVGSCLCAAAPTSTAFIIGRVVAGCGASGILQGTLNIISHAVPKKKVPLYYGYVLSVQGISACSAPMSTRLTVPAQYLYYIPIYFQAARGTSAINSGIRMIALDAARIVFIIISGGLISKFRNFGII